MLSLGSNTPVTAAYLGRPVSGFDRIVFVGASIMYRCFGQDLSARNSSVEALFAQYGADVEVYGYGFGGYTAGQIKARLTEAMAAFPDKTLFFVHAGGNNVSPNRPYPGGADDLTTGLNGLIDIAAQRRGAVIVSDLTFRDYGDATAANEALGSKPYNDNLIVPLLQSRKRDLVSRAYYSDGTPVSCLYEATYYNREIYLGSDNVHPADPDGLIFLRDWLAQRLAPICAGKRVPSQEDRLSLYVPPALSDDVDIWINLGGTSTAGVNAPSISHYNDNDGVTAEGPFDLLNYDGSDPSVSLTINYSDPAPGNDAGFGYNTGGRDDGTVFDGSTLLSPAFTSNSFFVGAAYSADHVLAGLEPNTAYTVELVASRASTDVRVSKFDFSNGESVTIQATADPTADPVVVSTMSDADGKITITQSAETGSWSYLSGIHIYATKN